MPASLHAILASRIDRLPGEAKRVLRAAAVIGAEVPATLLEAVVDLPEQELGDGLAQLQAAEILYEGQLFPDPGVPLQAHPHPRRRLREPAARPPPRAARSDRRGHRSADPDSLADQVERLAHHSFRGAAWDKAVASFPQAGTRAAARSAYREAVACFDQALEALAQLPEHRDTLALAVDLRLDLRASLQPSAEPARMLDLLHGAEAIAERLGILNGSQQSRQGCASISWSRESMTAPSPRRAWPGPGHHQWGIGSPGPRPGQPRLGAQCHGGLRADAGPLATGDDAAGQRAAPCARCSSRPELRRDLARPCRLESRRNGSLRRRAWRGRRGIAAGRGGRTAL